MRIIGTLIACMFHSTSVDVYPLTRVDTKATYTLRNVTAFAGAPPKYSTRAAIIAVWKARNVPSPQALK